MRKLITANFHRFSKDRFSWCVLGIVVILSLGNVFNSVGSFETMAASGYAVSLDEYYFNQAPLIGAFLALLISMFLGTEFSEGTIRNKLCIGHRGGQATIAHYFYAISYYIIAVTGGGCFERTKISFIPFQGRIQRSAAITYPFEEQPNSTRQIHGRSR